MLNLLSQFKSYKDKLISKRDKLHQRIAFRNKIDVLRTLLGTAFRFCLQYKLYKLYIIYIILTLRIFRIVLKDIIKPIGRIPKMLWKEEEDAYKTRRIRSSADV